VLTRFPLLVRLSAMALIVMFPALLPAGGRDESRARGENDADSQYSATGAYLGPIWCDPDGALAPDQSQLN
jgi:hypothetical protein